MNLQSFDVETKEGSARSHPSEDSVRIWIEINDIPRYKAEELARKLRNEISNYGVK